MIETTVRVKVKPGARAPGLVFATDGLLEIRVREAAVEGRATRAAAAALAQALGVAPSTVTLLRGMTSRVKTFRILGLPEERVRAHIAGLSSGARQGSTR